MLWKASWKTSVRWLFYAWSAILQIDSKDIFTRGKLHLPLYVHSYPWTYQVYFFIIVSTVFSCIKICFYSLKFHSSVWEPFYELKIYLPLPRLPRTFCVWTESLTGVPIFHILVPLKLLGEYHLVLAICYNSCYWFFLHKHVQKTSLCQTKGLSTSLSFLANTRCLGKIIRRKGVMIVSLNSPLAFNHLWLGGCQSSNSLLILKLLMIFFSTNLVLVEEKAGLIFHICGTHGKK